jgi:deoxyribodipyrimidine photo-lyase
MAVILVCGGDAPALMHTAACEQALLDRALVWMRRDLRVDDHAALYHALRAARQVWCAFVFDRDILDPLPRADRRVEFIRDSLVGVDAELRALGEASGVNGTGLIVRHGHGLAHEQVPALAASWAQAVYASHDDEPAALARDARVRGLLADAGIALHTVKDHVVFERSEVLTQSGSPYTVFTPYKNAWLKKLDAFFLRAYPVAPPCRRAGAMAPGMGGVPTLADIGFEPTNLHQLKLPTGPVGGRQLLDDFLLRIDRYADTRDFPAVKGPSYLSTHLRFGTVSIRQLAREAHAARGGGVARGRGVAVGAGLARLLPPDPAPPPARGGPRLQAANTTRSTGNTASMPTSWFDAWCHGRTGYPLVDAAMHQLNDTGYMHNRLRMVVASFLTKDLGHRLAARRGLLRRAAERLRPRGQQRRLAMGGVDGCDAQPYFRIFNPVAQSEKFDPQGRFIRRYLPQLASLPDTLMHAPWTGTAGGPAGRRPGAGPRLPRAHRAARGGAHAHAGTLCGGEGGRGAGSRQAALEQLHVAGARFLDEDTARQQVAVVRHTVAAVLLGVVDGLVGALEGAGR